MVLQILKVQPGIFLNIYCKYKGRKLPVDLLKAPNLLDIISLLLPWELA